MMRSRGRTTIKSVDDDPRHAVQDHPERGRIEALFDQNLFRMHIRRERSSAYWFAASLWGVSGLIIGGFIGAYLALQTSAASMPIAMEALARGMAVERGRQEAEEAPPIITDQREQQPQSDR